MLERADRTTGGVKAEIQVREEIEPAVDGRRKTKDADVRQKAVGSGRPVRQVGVRVSRV